MVPPTTETDFTYGDNHVFSDEELLSEEGAKQGTRTSVALKMSLLRFVLLGLIGYNRLAARVSLA
ncbi:hypothetical protein PPTG_24376 [Phytophthora nicotianae INRA-310]|uniref:Uncharacterized protein n=1 Tax=Phytophthora nicotianae (strain INRA-310) TaxID=761204 RepID=W2PHJ6_PHYN3|nr:hypothetical protein PPTG_24376 [Phytophthora nicotianae INRA-310]ETM99693.1 hypothetical protein PPTG_24376 [Phytophthora nicotianae INRA-310]